MLETEPNEVYVHGTARKKTNTWFVKSKRKNSNEIQVMTEMDDHFNSRRATVGGMNLSVMADTSGKGVSILIQENTDFCDVQANSLLASAEKSRSYSVAATLT